MKRTQKITYQTPGTKLVVTIALDTRDLTSFETKEAVESLTEGVMLAMRQTRRILPSLAALRVGKGVR